MNRNKPLQWYEPAHLYCCVACGMEQSIGRPSVLHHGDTMPASSHVFVACIVVVDDRANHASATASSVGTRPADRDGRSPPSTTVSDARRRSEIHHDVSISELEGPPPLSVTVASTCVCVCITTTTELTAASSDACLCVSVWSQG